MKLKLPITMTFNWASILFASFFLAYGYFGALCPEIAQFKEHWLRSCLAMIFLLGILVYFGFLAAQRLPEFSDAITLSKNDILVFLSFFIFLFVPAFEALQFSLDGDENSYAGTALIHGTKMALQMVRHFALFDAWPFKYFAQLISLFLLVALIGAFALTRRWRWQIRVAIFALLFIFGRIAISMLGGNGSSHPPLELVPPFVFGSLFGFNDFIFKLSYFSALIVFLLIFYRWMLRLFQPTSAFLLGLAVGTIPLLLHMSTVVEHSFWAAIAMTLVLAEIISASKINFMRMICLISVGTMMRQPLFFAVIPLFFSAFLEDGPIDRRNWRRWALMGSATLLFVPFIAASLIFGTNATQGLGKASLLAQIWAAISSGIIFNSMANSLSYLWMALMVFSILPILKLKRSRQLSIAALFCLAIVIYYSILPTLWGMGKYQSEYAMPFAIAGLILVGTWLRQYRYGLNIFNGLLLALVFLNLQGYMNLARDNQPADIAIDWLPEARKLHSGYRVMVAYPFEFKSALGFLKDKDLTSGVYSLGPTYGVLPEIMSGFSVADVRLAYDIYRQQLNQILAKQENTHNWDSASSFSSADLVNQDSRIKVVILGAVPLVQKQQIQNDLTHLGWTVINQFKNEKYTSTVVILERPADAK